MKVTVIDYRGLEIIEKEKNSNILLPKRQLSKCLGIKYI